MKNYIITFLTSIMLIYNLAQSSDDPERITSASFSPDTWHAVSFPIEPIRIDSLIPLKISVLFWDEGGAFNGIRKYYQMRDKIKKIRPGYGYYIRGISSFSINLDSLKEFTEDSLTIFLRKSKDGVNIIGNPYPFKIKTPSSKLHFLSPKGPQKPDISIINGKKIRTVSVGGSVIDWECDTVSYLEPWKGYIVYCPKDSTRLVFRKSDIVE